MSGLIEPGGIMSTVGPQQLKYADDFAFEELDPAGNSESMKMEANRE